MRQTTISFAKAPHYLFYIAEEVLLQNLPLGYTKYNNTIGLILNQTIFSINQAKDTNVYYIKFHDNYQSWVNEEFLSKISKEESICADNITDTQKCICTTLQLMQTGCICGGK